MKKICVSIVGSGQLHEVTIEPGTTAGDILRGLNLSDYLLSRSPSAEFFANTESVYEKLADGQKTFASTKATVGGEFLDAIIQSAIRHFNQPQAIQAAPSTLPNVVRVTHARTTHAVPIRRQLLPYWQEAGWSKNGSVYHGNYQTRYGAYQGWIEERSPYEIRFYILAPPSDVLESSHGVCFQPHRKNWFNVHMSTRPKDVSSGIVAIERLIAECAGKAR
jgi:hypothetical protein